MDWLEFINFIIKKNNHPVLLSVLRNISLDNTDTSSIKLICPNNGSRIFLENRRGDLEGLVSEFIGEKKVVSLVVVEKGGKKKRPAESLPLIEYQETSEKAYRETGLIDHFTFENFAVSGSNQIAHAAARAVSENPGHIYNPLFIYGDVGVGKTHLSQAVANNILHKNPSKKILYCTSEAFTNDLVESIRQKNTKKIRNKYRGLDVLVVDDIQFIAGKNYVQEEFYHTFNTIVQAGGQIILSSDKPPKEIQALEDRLRSRFSGGLIIDMQRPDFELRTAILLIKAQERNISIDMGAAQKLAQNIRDTRELEGALLKMMSLAIAENRDSITIESTEGELTKRQSLVARRVQPQEVIKTVATFYNIKQSDIKGQTRKQSIALARQVSMFLLREYFNLNYEDIASLLKRKDHTTVMHGVSKIKEKVMKDPVFNESVSSITSQLI